MTSQIVLVTVWALLEKLRKRVQLALSEVDLEVHVPACKVSICVIGIGGLGSGGYSLGLH